MKQVDSKHELARALFAAFAANDDEQVRRLCAPELEVRQNFGPTFGLDALLDFNAAVQAVVRDFRYEDALRTATESGFIEEHRVCGTLPGGSELDIAACVVAEVCQGRVVRLRETLDTAAASGLLAALA